MNIRNSLIFFYLLLFSLALSTYGYTYPKTPFATHDNNCGFIKPAGSYTSAPGIVNFHSAEDTGNGFQITGSTPIFNGSQVRTITTNLDDAGEWRTLSDEITQSPVQESSINIQKSLPGLNIEKVLADGTTAWTSSISFADESPLDFISPKAYVISDGVLILGTFVRPGNPYVGFIPFVVKLSTTGEEVRRVVDFEIPFNDILAVTNMYEVNSGYVFDSQLASSRGFVGVSFDLDNVWYQRYIQDLPSNRFADIKVSLDGNYIYAANVNNSISYLEKVDVFTGEQVYAKALDQLFYNQLGLPYFRSAYNWEGIIVCQDGGVVFGYDVSFFNLPVGSREGYVYGKVDASGNIIWGDTLQGYRSLKPVSETSNKEYIFVDQKQNGTNVEITAMKLSSSGDLSPACESATNFPDILISDLNLNSTIDIGSIVYFNFDLVNAGDAVASGDYTIGIYLSENESPAPGDQLVGIVPTGNTPIGTINDIAAAADIPAQTEPGNYYLHIVADTGNDITESNENNNRISQFVELVRDTPLPDLQIADLNLPSYTEAGTIINFNFDLINSGEITAEGDYIIGIYLSEDNSLGNNDELVGIVPTGNTPIGTIEDIVAAADIPSTTPAGDYYFIIVADTGNDIAESSEGNNLISGTIQVTLPPIINECGFLKPAGSYPVTYSYGSNIANLSAREDSTGYTITGHSILRVPNLDQQRTVTTHVDLNGDWTSLTDDTTIVIPALSPFTITEDTLQNLIVQKNISEDSVAWINTLSFEGINIQDFISVQVDQVSDGVLVMGTYVQNSTTGPVFVIKLSDQGEEEARFFDSTSFRRDYFSIGKLYEGNEGYVFDGLRDGSSRGFLGFPKTLDTVWYKSYANDLPSNRVADIKIGLHGRYIYAANVNNWKILLEKVDMKTGVSIYKHDLNRLFLNFLSIPYSPGVSWNGILLNEDGSIVTGYFLNLYGGTEAYSGPAYPFGKLDSNGQIVWADTLQGYINFKPLLNTSDGGYLFFDDQVSEGYRELSVMKLTSSGSRIPECGADEGIEIPCDLAYTLENQTLTVFGPGLTTGHIIVKLFDPNWGTVLNCVDNCNDPLIIEGLDMGGNYHLVVNTYDENWQAVCETRVDIPSGIDDGRRIGQPTNTSDRKGFTNSLESIISIYPNPSSGTVNIDLNQIAPDVSEIQMVNSMGSLVKHQIIESNTSGISQMNVQDLAEGIYYIRIFNQKEEALATKKLMIMKQ